MGSDAMHLGEALRIIEGLIVGDIARDIPDPELGISGVPVTLGKGLFLGRPLNSSEFLKSLEVVVRSPTGANAGTDREQTSTPAKDVVVVEFAVELPNSNTTAQRAVRDAAYKLDTQIRGEVLKASVLLPLGLDMFWILRKTRIALQDGTSGYGSGEFLVIESTYSLRRIESLTGGPT